MMAESADPYTSNDVGGMQQPSLNVSSIMRRKAEREQQPGGVSNPTYDAAAASAYQPSSENNTVSYEKMIQAQMAFLRTDLMLAIALPFTLLLYVSGIAGLFSLTFGGMLCYLLDLIGSVEGTMICVVLTLIAFTGTLMFALREFISQSIFNFLLIFIFGIFNCLVFVTILTHFNVVTTDLGAMLRIVLQGVLSIMPLFCATILSIFISVEVAEIELSTSFTVIYFLYTLFLGRPRYFYDREQLKTSTDHPVASRSVQPTLLVPLRLQAIVHVLPVLISVWIHFALHRNVMSSDRTFVLSAVNAVLLPSILMIFSFQRHLQSIQHHQHVQSSSASSSSKYLTFSLNVLCVVFALTIQDHPMFDELKVFSGKEEPVPTYIVMAMIMLLVCASILYSKIKEYKKNGAQDVLNSATWEFIWIKLMHVAFDVCIGTAAGLFGSLINMPSNIIPINLIAIIALSEFHFEESWSALSRILLSVIVALSFLISFVAFTKSTIYYLNYGFDWFIPCTMQQLCQLIAGLIALSAILPVGIITPTFSMWMNISDPLLPSGSSFKGSLLASVNTTSTSSQALHKTAVSHFVRHIFAYGSIALAVLTACMELMVMQQNWSETGLEVATEDVYPTNFLLISTGVMLTTTYFLYLYQAIGFSTSLVIVVIQGCKLLSLLDIGSEYIISIALLLISTILPFARQLSLYFQHSVEMEKHLASASAYLTATSSQASTGLLVSTTELAVYVAFHAAACLLVGQQVSNMLLSFVLYGDMNVNAHDERVMWWQDVAVTLSIWLGFVSCLLFIFHRTAKYLRSMIFGLSVVLLLIAFEGFGVLSISKSGVHIVDTNVAAANDYTHKPNSILSHDHSEFFLFMSSVLTVIAWMRYVSLQNFVSCLLYSIVFGFVSTKAMINWAFPWNPTFPDLTHGLTSFPFIFLLLNKIFNTFISLWNPKERAYPIVFQKMGYVAAISWPVLGFLFSEVVHHSNHVVRDGIVWSALLGSAMMTLSFRAREVLGFLRKDHTSAATPLVTFAVGKNEYSLVFLTTIVTLAWVIMSMILQTSTLDNDVLFPVFALLIFCCESKVLPASISPGQMWCLLAVVWWYGSVVYHILLRGYGEDNDGLVIAPYSMFGWDEEISLWTSKTLYLPLLNLALAMVPYPAIFMSLRKNRNDTEEMLFVLAILSGVAVIGGSVDCIRYLGLVGVFAAGYRCFEISRSSGVNTSYM